MKNDRDSIVALEKKTKTQITPHPNREKRTKFHGRPFYLFRRVSFLYIFPLFYWKSAISVLGKSRWARNSKSMRPGLSANFFGQVCRGEIKSFSIYFSRFSPAPTPLEAVQVFNFSVSKKIYSWRRSLAKFRR